MDRYEKANQLPPRALYTDRDCCNKSGPSKYQLMFWKWKDLQVRIDSWHFMRRLAKMCTNESHPLYGTFMSKVSASIFEWDAGDVQRLMTAKKHELRDNGVENPSDDAARKVAIHFINSKPYRVNLTIYIDVKTSARVRMTRTIVKCSTFYICLAHHFMYIVYFLSGWHALMKFALFIYCAIL